MHREFDGPRGLEADRRRGAGELQIAAAATRADRAQMHPLDRRDPLKRCVGAGVGIVRLEDAGAGRGCFRRFRCCGEGQSAIEGGGQRNPGQPSALLQL